MDLRKVISVFAVLAVVFATSCSKMDTLKEKEGTVEESHSCDGACGLEEKGMMLNNENGEDPNITDPDHDEEHDKDDSQESKES